ncbi:SDR family NAD(P)-dependent oxidoreductase [Nitrospirillum sp. BR 11163]|uniref:SDR family NAD(P)-dependent oxidoreductase n=1 Tax=Nitrospirillum sp. BR 11163 TaxID=3104323 RepID=UPI002AFDFEA6|nr:SDR family NAD(P)-dependent oxidoreductase [Nitrospirillum sp. BR 11163]MEA1672784.1 SDR family NAD(P)-dependent oxidoreductase [Nitrospirillum sp. BR 11163]
MNSSDIFDVRGLGVIVTGGASGLGLGFAEALAANGARVTLMDMNETTLAAQVERLSGLGYDVRGVRLDVTDRPALHQAFDETTALYGRLDVVFANAGIDPGPGFVTGTIGSNDRTRPEEFALENYADARWDRVIEVNLNSVFSTLKAAARNMKPQRRGRIIVTTSIAAFANEAAIGAAYMATKAGAAHLMRNAALELAKHNIRVNAIAPGPFLTNIGDGYIQDPKIQEVFARAVPLGRIGKPADMTGLALFLASEASSFVTGEQIVIDGGAHMGMPD